MYEILFDMNVNMCERFPALDPFRVREQRFHDVLLIFRRLNNKHKKGDKDNPPGSYVKNGVLYRPAQKDDWW